MAQLRTDLRGLPRRRSFRDIHSFCPSRGGKKKMEDVCIVSAGGRPGDGRLIEAKGKKRKVLQNDGRKYEI